VRRKLAEGEGFEPPKGLRPGGFQVPEKRGTKKHHGTSFEAIQRVPRQSATAISPLVSGSARWFLHSSGTVHGSYEPSGLARTDRLAKLQAVS
jgi:hypothetical protein